MLKREWKIGKELFRGLVKPLKSVSGDTFILKVFPIGGSKKPQFAVSISKKVEKSAVLRNKIRRVVYGSIKNVLSDFKPGFAYHFIVKSKPKELENDINREISNLMQQI
jgi:ribonuclease P protein component